MTRVAGIFLLSLALGDLLGSSDAATTVGGEETKGSARQAVVPDYLEWVSRWGEKIAAKEESRIAGQEDEKNWRFVNVVATESSQTIVVDSKRGGDVRTVQQAVDMMDTGNEKRVVIQINPGTYRSYRNSHPIHAMPAGRCAQAHLGSA